MRAWPVACVLLCASASARADEPWAKGVTAEAKEDAQALLEEGNSLFAKERFKDALDLYAEAVKAWDHPAIRFNMVRALVALDRPVEAADNLDLALAHGAAALEAHVYRDALNYQRLLEGRLARLAVSCAQDGVEVTLDGEPFLSCPGERMVRTEPGRRALIAKKPGLVTLSDDLVLPSGETTALEIVLPTFSEVTEMRTRWPRWQPWAVGGAGLGVVALGVLLDLKASSDLDAFHEAVAAQCVEDCFASTVDRSQADLAVLENRIAISLIVVGAVAVAAGVAGVILNRPRPYVTDDGAGVAIAGRF